MLNSSTMQSNQSQQMLQSQNIDSGIQTETELRNFDCIVKNIQEKNSKSQENRISS